MKKMTAVLLAGMCLLSGCSKKNSEPEVIMKSLNITSAISSAKELTTLKYEYVDFGQYEKSGEKISIPFIGEKEIPLTKDEIIFTYSGTICIGFDLEEIVPVVDEENKIITVKVPEPVVLSHTPNHDAEKYYEIKGSVLTSRQEAVNTYEDIKETLRKEKEASLIEDEKVREDAVKEYKNICESWLLKADPEVNNYKIQYEEETEKSTSS